MHAEFCVKDADSELCCSRDRSKFESFLEENVSEVDNFKEMEFKVIKYSCHKISGFESEKPVIDNDRERNDVWVMPMDQYQASGIYCGDIKMVRPILI